MRLNLGIVALTVIILLVAIFIAFDLHRASKEEVLLRVSDHQLLVARQVTSEIKSYLQDRSGAIRVLSSFASLQYHDTEHMPIDINAYFEYLKREHVKVISVYDENGTIIYSTDENAIGLNYQQCEFFVWAKQSKNYGKIFVSPLIRFAALTRSHPISDSYSLRRYTGRLRMPGIPSLIRSMPGFSPSQLI